MPLTFTPLRALAQSLAQSLALALSLLVGSVASAGAQKIATETAIFAGGCFWCTESDFDKVPGVVSTTSGYIGGKTEKPTYDQVTRGNTGHAEAVRVEYDPARVSYEKLVEFYWRTIDPVDAGGQFCDRGDSYRTAIFTQGADQERIAKASLAKLTASNKLGKPIATQIVPAATFTPAEDYHQDFYSKSPARYYSYRAGCGRDARLKQLWGDEAGGKALLN